MSNAEGDYETRMVPRSFAHGPPASSSSQDVHAALGEVTRGDHVVLEFRVHLARARR